MTKLTVETREKSTSLDSVRAAGKIPAVVYGDGETVVISVPRSEFIALYKEAGTSTILEMTGLTEAKDVLVKDMQYDPVSGEILHIDFYATTKGEKMEAEVSIEFIGVSEAEKSGAQVIKVMREIMVEAEPRNLPSEITVDLSAIVKVGDTITVSDLPALEGVVYLADAEDAVVTSSEAQEIVEEEVEAIDMSAIETEQKGKGEEASEEA